MCPILLLFARRYAPVCQAQVLAITRENVLANGVASKARVAELVWGSDPLPPFALVRLRYCAKLCSHPVLMFSRCTLLSALPRAGAYRSPG